MRGWSEAADAEIAVNNHQGDIDVGEDASEILIGFEQFRIAVMQAVVEDAELLIAGLQFGLGGFHLFIGGLQLFGGGLVFLRSDLIGMGEGLQFVGELRDLFTRSLFSRSIAAASAGLRRVVFASRGGGGICKSS